MNHDQLLIPPAAPGVYAIRSESPTLYLLDLRGRRPKVMRTNAKRPLDGEGVWQELVDLISGPPLQPDGDVDMEDVRNWVVRVGARHKMVYDVGRLDADLYWIGRVVERIDGPLSDDELAELLAAPPIAGT